MKLAARLLLAILLLSSPGARAQPQNPAGQGGPATDFVAPGPIVPLPPPVSAAVERLRAPNLAAHIEFLAAPSLEGRGLGRQGLEVAAEYVAAGLALAGIDPAPDTDDAGPSRAGRREAYFHEVPVGEFSNARGGLTVQRGVGAGDSRSFASGVDCLLPEVAPQELAAPVVFAGYGLRELAAGRDDYRGLDVHGKIVVVVGGLPPGQEWQTPELIARFAAEKGRARYAAKVELAAALGAKAVLGVEGDDLAAPGAGKPAVAAPYFLPADDTSPADVPLVLVTRAVAGALLGMPPGGLARLDAESPRALTGVRATMRLVADERPVVARNVIAVIPGADATLRGEAVVIGAHVDHLGRSASGLYPGADDNASGVAALLEIAKAFASSPVKPRRTIVFAFWTGEEEGHLGSEYFTRHPAWPLDRITAYLNLDMIAHPWLREEVEKLVADTHLPDGRAFLDRVNASDFMEPGVAAWAPELCPVLEQAGRGVGLALHFDRTDGKNGGSDYRAFARKGIRFIRFFGNYFPGYHQPTDTPAGADPTQVLKMARLALATTWLLADK